MLRRCELLCRRERSVRLTVNWDGGGGIDVGRFDGFKLMSPCTCIQPRVVGWEDRSEEYYNEVQRTLTNRRHHCA